MKPRIPNHEFNERILNTQKVMREEGLDLLLCYGNECEPQYTRYYADYWPLFESAGVLIPVEGEPILLIGAESETFASSFHVLKKFVRFYFSVSHRIQNILVQSLIRLKRYLMKLWVGKVFLNLELLELALLHR